MLTKIISSYLVAFVFSVNSIAPVTNNMRHGAAHTDGIRAPENSNSSLDLISSNV